MIKVKLEVRINRFLENFTGATYIPLHPDDYNLLKSEGRLASFPLPLKKLGEINPVVNQ